jgi:very-short-patch-repair endonuclease
VESPLERDFLTLVRERSMPEPVAQYPVFIDGHLVARLDFAYPELKVGIELDGYAFHSGRESFERDRRRLTELVNEGWHMLVFTRPQLRDHPAWVEKAVLKARARAAAGLPRKRAQGLQPGFLCAVVPVWRELSRSDSQSGFFVQWCPSGGSSRAQIRFGGEDFR